MKNYDVLTQFYNEPFYAMPKRFLKDGPFKSLSNNAKLMYMLLFDRSRLSLLNGWIDLDGEVFVYYTIESIASELSISKTTCIKCFKELINADLVKKKKQRFGQPDMIYVNSFKEIEKSSHILSSY